MTRLERATKRHAREMARIMREEDKLEVRVSGGFLPEQALRGSINRSSEAWALYVDDDLLMVFGVAQFSVGWSSPWALCSVHVAKHQTAFWRASKLLIAEIRERYPHLMQMVYARSSSSLRWVERLGFKVGQPERWGRDDTLFCKITMDTPKLIYEGRVAPSATF